MKGRSNDISNESDDNNNVENQVKMVAIRIEDASQFIDSPEFAALSYVASTSITAISNEHDDDTNDDGHFNNNNYTNNLMDMPLIYGRWV